LYQFDRGSGLPGLIVGHTEQMQCGEIVRAPCQYLPVSGHGGVERALSMQGGGLLQAGCDLCLLVGLHWAGFRIGLVFTHGGR